MALHRALLGGCVLVWCCSSAMAGEWTPDPSLGNPEQHRRLYDIGRRYGDVNFDTDANLVGTHSKKPPNKRQHSTRESTYYAYGLLLSGDPADNAQAQAILKRIVTFQDTNPSSGTYGLFNWNSEDVPGDQNSAAFVGLTLVDVLDLDGKHPSLDGDLRIAIEKSVKLALGEVMRRDVDPGYTNIAMLSLAFASGGEKLLQVPGAGKWAEAKLDAVLKLADDGEFAEYLSPTYTGVALQGAYMAQKLAFSDSFAAKTQTVIDHLWKQVGLAYHAPSYQLGGPYQRAYGDNMLEYASALKYFLYLGTDGNYPLNETEADHDWDMGGLVSIVDLPVKPRPEMKTMPPPWRAWDAVGTPPTPVRHLFQYREGDFILGTVQFQDEWKQKRNLVAFWRNPGPAPLGMKVGLCIDESNESLPGFAGEKIHWYSQQKKGTTLVVLEASTDVPGQGVSTLVFDDGAAMSDNGGGDGSVKITDGTITTYLYPISSSQVKFESELDKPHRVMRITRSWNSSDHVGPFHIMSYIAAFRPADQAAPAVSELRLLPDNGGSAEATVDGEKFTVPFKVP